MTLLDIREKFGLKSWTEVYDKQCEYLDKIDFTKYIDAYDNLEDMWLAVEEDYDDSPLSDNDFLQGNIFNYLSRYELQEYLRLRYHLNFYTEEIIRYHKVN